jgi:hypothetical protein
LIRRITDAVTDLPTSLDVSFVFADYKPEKVIPYKCPWKAGQDAGFGNAMDFLD